MKLRLLVLLTVIAAACVLPGTALANIYTGTVEPTTGDAVKVIGAGQIFYPYVHDGYRDTATFRAYMTDPNFDCYSGSYAYPPAYTATIRNTATGHVVRTLTWTDSHDDTVGNGSGSAHIFRWDGKNAAGTPVKIGTHYRVTVSVVVYQCDDGTGMGSTVDVYSSVKPGFTITTAKGWRTVTKTKKKLGRYTYAHSGCNSRADGWDWWLDSGFGCSDTATYRFGVPTSGTHVGGGIYAPYKQGPFLTSLSRSGGYVYLKVTAAQGSYGDVQTAHLSYRTKVRI